MTPLPALSHEISSQGNRGEVVRPRHQDEAVGAEGRAVGGAHLHVDVQARFVGGDGAVLLRVAAREADRRLRRPREGLAGSLARPRGHRFTITEVLNRFDTENCSK